APGGPLVGEALGDARVREALPRAEEDLAQVRVDRRLEPERAAEDRRGLVRALEIGRVERDRTRGGADEAGGEGRGLSAAARVQAAALLALKDEVLVVVGLAMADEQQLGMRHARLGREP